MGEPCKLHVGNLSYDCTEEDIRKEFEKCGAVEQGLYKKGVLCETIQTLANIFDSINVCLSSLIYDFLLDSFRVF